MSRAKITEASAVFDTFTDQTGLNIVTPCHETCEVYSRVSGYHRPVKNWNEGKREEFRERKTFTPEAAQ